MRLIVWNIAYGTGCARSYTGHIARVHNYLHTPRTNLERIADFLEPYKPDVLGLVEVDSGSFRTGFCSQVKDLANKLELQPFSRSKYAGNSLYAHIPILGRQHNAVLCRQTPLEQKIHFLPIGMKKLVIETVFPTFSLFLVHLALSERAREKQSDALAAILPHERPFILAGDFNTFAGTQELIDLKRRFALKTLNVTHEPTFPAWQPKHELDFMLVSHTVEGTLTVPDIQLSDHLPLVADLVF